MAVLVIFVVLFITEMQHAESYFLSRRRCGPHEEYKEKHGNCGECLCSVLSDPRNMIEIIRCFIIALLAVLEKRNPHVHIVELRRRLLRCYGIEPFGIRDSSLSAHIQQDIVKGGMFNALQSCDRSILAKWAVWSTWLIPTCSIALLLAIVGTISMRFWHSSSRKYIASPPMLRLQPRRTNSVAALPV
ncbi:hypothetical protein MTO96_050765 [Rhipicephalus appendiculatus]